MGRVADYTDDRVSYYIRLEGKGGNKGTDQKVQGAESGGGEGRKDVTVNRRKKR